MEILTFLLRLPVATARFVSCVAKPVVKILLEIANRAVNIFSSKYHSICGGWTSILSDIGNRLLKIAKVLLWTAKVLFWLAFGSLGIIAFYVMFFPHGPWAYALKYNTSIDDAYVESEPPDCDWDYAPIGNKGCHYEKQISVIRYKTNTTGQPIVTYDDGKTRNCLAEGGQLGPSQVHVTWLKIKANGQADWDDFLKRDLGPPKHCDNMKDLDQLLNCKFGPPQVAPCKVKAPFVGPVYPTPRSFVPEKQ